MIDLYHRADAAETDPKRIIRLRMRRQIGRHQAVAMRLIAKVEKQFNIVAAAAAAAFVKANTLGWQNERLIHSKSARCAASCIL